MVFEIDDAKIEIDDDFMKEVIREYFEITDLFSKEEIERLQKVKGRKEYRVVAHPGNFARILFTKGYIPVEDEEGTTWNSPKRGFDILPGMWNYLGARVIPTGDGDFVTEDFVTEGDGSYYFPKEFVEAV